jgi:hypothetical protein
MRGNLFSLFTMSHTIVYAIRQQADGMWSIDRADSILTDGLKLGPAILQARKMARAEHMESGAPTCVEMHGVDDPVRLADYVPLHGKCLTST